MERAITLIVYVVLGCLVALTAMHVLSGREPSQALLTLLGTVLGAVVGGEWLKRKGGGGDPGGP